MEDHKDQSLFDGLDVGKVYNVRGRNFVIAVYKGDGVFIGLREKFNYLRVDYEYLRDHPKHKGTDTLVCEDRVPIGEIDQSIPLNVSGPTVDKGTKRRVAFDTPVAEGGRGWYFIDTGEAPDWIRPICYLNDALYEALLAFEPNREKELEEWREKVGKLPFEVLSPDDF